MATKERKITFHTLVRKNYLSDDGLREELPFTQVTDTIRYLLDLNERVRLDNIERDANNNAGNDIEKNTENLYSLSLNKKCSLGFANIEELGDYNIITGAFKSAEFKYRPPLIDVNQNTERPSPKKFTEGEKEHTHFAIKVTNEEVFLVLETNGKGVTINQTTNFLEFFAKESIIDGVDRRFSLIHTKIVGNDFLETLESMDRVKLGEVHFNKQLLGSDALNFSGRTHNLQRDLILTLKAERRKDIKESLIDIFNVFREGNSISKVRIYGDDENGEKISLDTSFMEKTEIVNASLNSETGEVQSPEMISYLKRFVNLLS